MSTVILASRYNTLRDRIDKILGTSTVLDPQYGYGQNFIVDNAVGSRTSLSTATSITAEQYKNLYIDILRARIHQVGVSAVTINPFVVGDYDTNTTSTDKVEETYISNLEALASNIETDKFLIYESTQADVEQLYNSVGNPIISSRIFASRGAWNGTLTHIVDVTFANAASRRHFFNAGGQIRLAAEVDYAGIQSKTVQWQSALAAMGTISITANSTYSNNSVGTGSSIGNYQLTGTYALCYSHTPGGAYARNYYNVQAYQISDSVIRIRVQFIDGAPLNTATGIDENVLGDFYSSFGLLVPNGTATINSVSTNTVTYNDTITGTTVTSL